jgi:hypothetical protein
MWPGARIHRLLQLRLGYHLQANLDVSLRILCESRPFLCVCGADYGMWGLPHAAGQALTTKPHTTTPPPLTWTPVFNSLFKTFKNLLLKVEMALSCQPLRRSD